MSYIYIVPLEWEQEDRLRELEAFLPRVFQRPTKRGHLKIDLKGAFDPNRGQYNSSLILRQLIAQPPGDAEKVLAVVEVDLFIPILTFVFGEAQVGGIGAVVSTHRLHNGFYGLPEDRRLTDERLIKEAVHELGHTFGLIHCSQPECVMNSSTYVENIDLKPAQPCPVCQGALQKKMPPRVKRRFRFPWW